MIVFDNNESSTPTIDNLIISSDGREASLVPWWKNLSQQSRSTNLS